MKQSLPPFSGPFGRGQNRREPERKHKLNAEIRYNEIRVIGPDNEQLGVMTAREAQAKADEMGFDLIEIAPQAKPPVCRISDYGKFIYEQQKREKTQKKNAVSQSMKEIRFKWRTDTHDYNFKTKHAREFILDGNKVKGSVMFRGREITHSEIGRELLVKFVEDLADIAKVDSPIKLEGKNMNVVLSPDKTKKLVKPEKEKKAKDDEAKPVEATAVETKVTEAVVEKEAPATPISEE